MSAPAARPTMMNLIRRVRDLIGDPDTDGTPVWSDAQIQEHLERTMEHIYPPEIPLIARVELKPAGQPAEFHFFEAKDRFMEDVIDWEEEPLLYNPNMTPVVPDEYDCANGHFIFTTSRSSMMLFIKGQVFDPFAAAESLLRLWAAKEALNYDTAWNYAAYKESQKRVALLALAEEYSRRKRINPIQMVRSDANPNTRIDPAGRNPDEMMGFQ